MRFSSVVGYHMNPMTCGVAKFNTELAKRLGVPFVGLGGQWGQHALLSLKWSEFDDVTPLLMSLPVYSKYSVFWHDKGNEIVSGDAQVVFHADPSLGKNGLFCPSLIDTKPRVVKLFAFGMAHKLQTAHYAKVRAMLEKAGFDYQLRVSVGLHEGTSLSDATQHFDALKEIMGAEKVKILGILSDEAVADELANSDAVLAFFEKGLRANNTTVHAALAAGARVVSNCDEQTPVPLRMAVWNAEHFENWPWIFPKTASIYTWDNLIKQMEKICAATVDWQPTHI